MSTLTVAVATLSVNKQNWWLVTYTPSSIVSTLAVAVATLGVNKLKRWLEICIPSSI